MAGICRVGVDAAGGTIIGNLAPTVFVNNSPVVVIGALIAPHDNHVGAVMIQGSPNVFANNIAVCRAGDAASCGHTAGPGSSDTFAN